MTNKSLFDPAKNRAHYEANERYQRDDNRLKEHRVLWIIESIRSLNLLPGARLLDLGAADGFIAELLPEGIEYLGIELNQFAIANAYLKAKGKIIQADATTYDYPEGGYHVILAGEILEHVIEPVSLLTRLRRALVPSGHIITTSALGRGEAVEPGNEEHLREWSMDEYRGLHESAGFEVLQHGAAEVYRLPDGRVRYTNAILARVARVGEKNDERGVAP